MADTKSSSGGTWLASSHAGFKSARSECVREVMRQSSIYGACARTLEHHVRGRNNHAAPSPPIGVVDVLRYANREIIRTDAGFPQYHDTIYKRDGSLDTIKSICAADNNMQHLATCMLHLRHLYEGVFEAGYIYRHDMVEAGMNPDAMRAALQKRTAAIEQLVAQTSENTNYRPVYLKDDVEKCLSAIGATVKHTPKEEPEIAKAVQTR